MKKLITGFLAAAMLIAFVVLPLRAQNATGQTVKVKIYLLDYFEVSNMMENLNMLAVEREVNAKTPLLSALEAQMAGATEDDNTQLLYSPFSGINLISLRVKNKTAYAHFTLTDSEKFDKIDAMRFRNSVRRTVLQFPSVHRIEICLDGVSDFWLIGAKTHRKCSR